MTIYPTLSDLCGIPTPKHVEGTSIRPLLADPEGAVGHARRSRPTSSSNHAVRTEGWRYIRYANGDEELYDEATDPYEWTNLADDPRIAATKAELAKSLPDRGPPRHRRRARQHSDRPAAKEKARQEKRADGAPEEETAGPWVSASSREIKDASRRDGSSGLNQWAVGEPVPRGHTSVRRDRAVRASISSSGPSLLVQRRQCSVAGPHESGPSSAWRQICQTPDSPSLGCPPEEPSGEEAITQR